MTDVFPVHLSENTALDVVFLHGLDGDSRRSWSREDPDSFWPYWLAQDVDGLSVWTVDYDAWSSGYRGRSMHTQDRAINLMAQLQNNGIGDRPLCFVAHSMGGLLVKEILMHAAEGQTDYRTFASAVRGVVFLATPHTGSGIVTAVEALGRIYRRTKAVTDLKRGSAHLRHLNDRYRDWVSETAVRNLVFFENLPTAGLQVVDAVSANPGLPKVRPIAVDANHIDICKPASRSSVMYGQVKRLVQALAGPATMAPPPHGSPAPPPDDLSVMAARMLVSAEGGDASTISVAVEAALREAGLSPRSRTVSGGDSGIEVVTVRPAAEAAVLAGRFAEALGAELDTPGAFGHTVVQLSLVPTGWPSGTAPAVEGLDGLRPLLSHVMAAAPRANTVVVASDDFFDRVARPCVRDVDVSTFLPADGHSGRHWIRIPGYPAPPGMVMGRSPWRPSGAGFDGHR